MQFAVSRQREYLADASGVPLTRYPPGLISALEEAARTTRPSIHTASKATAHLWIEEPLDTESKQGRHAAEPPVRHPPAARRPHRRARSDVARRFPRSLRCSAIRSRRCSSCCALVAAAAARRACVRWRRRRRRAVERRDHHDDRPRRPRRSRRSSRRSPGCSTRRARRATRPRAHGEDRQHADRRTRSAASTRPTSSTRRSSRAASPASPRSSTRTRPTQVGPVRSVRNTDQAIVWPIGGIFAYSGRRADAVDGDQRRAGADGSTRTAARPTRCSATTRAAGAAQPLRATSTRCSHGQVQSRVPPPAAVHVPRRGRSRSPGRRRHVKRRASTTGLDGRRGRGTRRPGRWTRSSFGEPTVADHGDAARAAERRRAVRRPTTGDRAAHRRRGEPKRSSSATAPRGCSRAGKCTAATWSRADLEQRDRVRRRRRRRARADARARRGSSSSPATTRPSRPDARRAQALRRAAHDDPRGGNPASVDSAHGRRAHHRHRPRQAGPRGDAARRRHHGRRRRRAGEDRRGRRRGRGDGARAGARRHPPRRRRRPHERPVDDRGHPDGGHDPGDGQVPHRPLRRGAGAPGARRRLRRRVRGAHPGRRGVPRRQVGVHRAVRVRRDEPRRGAAAHQRRRVH